MANPSAVVVISRFLSGMYTREDLEYFIRDTNSMLVKLFLGIIQIYDNAELFGVSDVEISAEFALAFPQIEQSYFEFMHGLVFQWLDGTVSEEL